jgi:thiol-disulfide isomerase/thioredoxin
MLKTFFVFAFSIMAVSNVCSQDVQKIRITELQKTIAESKNPLIVNFWATYCVPCLKEIPYFETMVKEHEKDGVKLLLVSLDLKEDYSKIRPVASRLKFASSIVWLNETDADYFCPRVDSAWSGALPASLFINNATGYHRFFEEQLTEEKLAKEMKALIGKAD